jgi:hypothetical protein
MAHSSTRPVKPPDQGWTSPADDKTPTAGWVGQANTAYNTQSSTTVRSVNSGAPSKISIMVALAA